MTRLAGEKIASLPFERQDDAVLEWTPTPLRNLGQHHFERVLQKKLTKAGTSSIEFSQQWESAVQKDGHVVSRIRDLATDQVEEVQSDDVIAAD